MWLSILVVLVLSGLWHGASWHFIVWGAANALILIAYTSVRRNKFFVSLTSKMNDWVANKFMLISISAACVFFRASSVHKAINMLVDMFKNIPSQISLIIHNARGERLSLLYLKQSGFDFFVGLILIIAFTLMEKQFMSSSIDTWLITKSKRFRWTVYYIFIISFIFIGVFKKTEFIYFQF
jgi:hypothetical protein